MVLSLKNVNMQILLVLIVVVVVVMYLKPELCASIGIGFGGAEHFDGTGGACVAEGGQCGPLGYPYAEHDETPKDTFSSCYQQKQIYLSSADPDEMGGHGDVNLEQRWGKLYININCNLPYAKGGVFNTMWGAYHAFLVDTRNNKSINLGSLVRHGDRFYKLSTELLGDYSNYNEIWVYIQTEDYAPKLKLKGSITGQQCSSL